MFSSILALSVCFLCSLVVAFIGVKPHRWLSRIVLCGSLAGSMAIDGFCQNGLTENGSAVFNYLSGPNFCLAEYGYTVPAFCTAPGELPLGSFAPPPIGGHYVDANFGATIRMLTDGTTNSVHQYSTPSPFSATGKYVFISRLDGSSRILETATARTVADVTAIVDPSSALWSPHDDDVLYSIGCYPCYGSQSPAQIYKYQVSTGQKTTLIDYATNGSGLTYIGFGGTGDLSADNWASFWSSAQHEVCAVDLNQLKTYCADYTAPNPNNRVGWTFIDYVTITKGVDIDTNKRYVLLMAQPAMGVYSVNLQTGKLDFEFRGPEFPVGIMGGDSGQHNHDGICDPGEGCFSNPHADVFQDNGRQYILVDSGQDVPTCEDDLVSLQISKGINMFFPVASGGGRKLISTLFKCSLTWSDLHFGCAKSTNAFCVVSTDIQPPNLPTQIRDGKTPFQDEVIAMRGNGIEVRRLAEHRSVRTSYWDTPRASISNDGSTVLWDSNFGNPANHRVVVTGTGWGTTLSCSYSLSSTSLIVGDAASAGSLSVTPSSTSCTPSSASSNVAWASISATSNAINWTVTNNPSSQTRSGALMIAGEIIPITQAGTPCSYSLSTSTLLVGAISSTGTIRVTPTPADCSLAPATSDVSWASAFTAGASVNWSIAPNSGSKTRSGNFVVDGHNVAITQSGAACSYALGIDQFDSDCNCSIRSDHGGSEFG